MKTCRAPVKLSRCEGSSGTEQSWPGLSALLGHSLELEAVNTTSTVESSGHGDSKSLSSQVFRAEL